MSAADTARVEIGGRMTTYEQEVRDHALQTCRVALGESDYVAAWEAGRAMTLQQAIALVA